MKKVLILFVFSLVLLISKAQNTITYNMKMWTTYTATMWDDSSVTTWGFSEGSKYPPLPGPTLYANEGDTVIINIRNQSQPYHHTIHWHGLDVDQANDGVPQTSFDLSHMQDSTYTFVATHAGTYLYHCHVASVVHVQMGMYGTFIVRAKEGEKKAYTGGPSFTKEYNWLMSEIDKSWHDSVPIHHDKVADSVYEEFNIPPYVPDYFLINGKAHQQLETDSLTYISAGINDTVFLRLSNVGYYLNEIQFPAGVVEQIIMSDGRPLPSSFSTNKFIIAPGERYGVLLTFNNMIDDVISVNYTNMNNPDYIINTEAVPLRIGTNSIVETKQQKDIIAYPNPGNVFWIDGINEKTQVYVYDLQGKLVDSQLVLPDGQQSIDLSDKEKGTYIISFENEAYSKTIKVIKD